MKSPESIYNFLKGKLSGNNYWQSLLARGKSLFARLVRFYSCEEKDELLSFALVKNFAIISFILIFCASVLLAWVVGNNAREVLLERSRSYSELFAEKLNRQVFLQFVLPTVVRYGKIALSDERQFNRLDTIVHNIIKGMSIKSVTIYDSRENIISYSTIPELVGKKNLGGLEYERARKGEDVSVLQKSGSLFSLLPGTKEINCTLTTYVPFRQEDRSGMRTGEIMGVIEVVQDLSPDLKAIISLQGRIILTSLFIMFFLFTVLTVIVIRANRIIAKRARERLLLKEKLGEAQRLATLGKMVASVSHEIKNPLGIVKSTAEVLRKRIVTIAPGNENLTDVIIEETGRLDGIVREFLDFAKPKEVELKPVSLNDLVMRVISFMQSEFIKNEIEVYFEPDNDLPEKMMDGEQLYQVLFNMIYNSVQAVAKGGKIVIKTGYDPGLDEVWFSVADDGMGISADKIDHIFTPFFTDKSRGTGLGLAIAKNIIDKHSGRIEVESKPGKGTRFIVFIPDSSKRDGRY